MTNIMDTNLKEQYSHAAIAIPVPNLLETLDYYENRLGFEVTFRWGEPVTYAVGKLGAETQIHFTQAEDLAVYATSLYIFVHNVNNVYDELKKNGVKILNEIDDRDYGMRDFDIVDVNGYRLTFATSIDMLQS